MNELRKFLTLLFKVCTILSSVIIVIAILFLLIFVLLEVFGVAGPIIAVLVLFSILITTIIYSAK